MNQSWQSDIKAAVDTLRHGGLILYPTDTVWGIGCDATDGEAVRRVFELKRRDDSKALITLVDSVAALERVVDEVPEVAYQLVDVAVDPLTIVYDRGVGIAPELLAADGSIGVRVVSEGFVHELCRAFRRPLVSTSANISGEPAARCFAEISPEIISGVDYVCMSCRDSLPAKASSVIKISKGGEFVILRK